MDPKAKRNSIRRSARSRGLEFNLSLEDVVNLLATPHCYYSGRKLTEENFTIDRVKNHLGYVKGNVVACCKEVNRIKSTLIEDPHTRLTANELKSVLVSFKEFCK